MIKVVDTAAAGDIVTPAGITKSWKKLKPLPNDIQQNNVSQKVTLNNEFGQQFFKVNITPTDKIKNWM